MMIHRTTLTAQSEDLAVLKQEARRRGLSLAALLMQVVEREAAAIRAARRPRIGVVHRSVSIAQAISDDEDAPQRSEFRTA